MSVQDDSPNPTSSKHPRTAELPAPAPKGSESASVTPEGANPGLGDPASPTAEAMVLPAPPSPVKLEDLFPDYVPKAFARKVRQERQRWITELQRAYLSEGLVLYLGAGVSMSIGLPSWNELIHALTVTMMSRKVNSAARALEELQAEGRAATLSALLEEAKQRRDTQKPILMMARAIKDEMGDDLTFQVALHLYAHLGGLWGRLGRLFGGFLRQAFGGWPEDHNIHRPISPLPTSELLDAVVALARPQREVRGVQAIVNYNYDDIVDERLRMEAVPCVTIRSGKDKQPRGSLPSFHVHGVLPMRAFVGAKVEVKKIDAGNFVFSEDEYHTEYADPYRWSNLTQIGLLGRHRGLFIGLSMQDPNLRRLIDVTHKQYPEVWNYAILPRLGAPPDEDTKGAVLRNLSEDVEARTFQKIGVKVIWVDDVENDVAPVLDRVRAIPEE